MLSDVVILRGRTQRRMDIDRDVERGGAFVDRPEPVVVEDAVLMSLIIPIELVRLDENFSGIMDPRSDPVTYPDRFAAVAALRCGSAL